MPSQCRKSSQLRRWLPLMLPLALIVAASVASAAPAAVADHVVISEVETFANAVGPRALCSEFVEIHNPTAAAIDLGQYYLTDATFSSNNVGYWRIAGNLAHGGLVELAFGCTIRELLEDFGGGSATGRPQRTVQIGGPLGAYVPAAQFDLPMDYEALAAAGALVGHGGLVAFDDAANLPRMARHALAFCAHESCGKCTPCRIGSTRGVEIMDEVIAGQNGEANVALLTELLDTMQYGSLCGLGGMTPFPVRSLLQHFPEDFLDVQH